MLSKYKIRKTYSLAAGIVVCLLVISQFIIQFFLHIQADSGRLINIAGRQRMLSQKLSKLALLIKANPSNTNYSNKFKSAFFLFTQSHENLIKARNDLNLNHQNSESINLLLKEISPFYRTIKTEGAKIFKEKQSFNLTAFIEAEEAFLPIMNQIVFLYDNETDGRIKFISILEYILFGLAILIIGFESFFLIIPLEKEIVLSYEKLEAKEEMAKMLSNRLLLLNKALQQQNDEITASQKELVAQKEEINTLLNTMEEKVRTRTALLDYQNEKFKEYAFMNSHNVRGPLARIIGLIQLINMEKDKFFIPTEHNYIGMLANTSQELDQIIRDMNRLLEEVQFFEANNNPR